MATKSKFGAFKSFIPTAGGCINNGGIVSFEKETVFIKWNSASSYPDMFEVEASGLNLLRKGFIKVPEVIDTGSAGAFSYILLEAIQLGSRKSGYWEELGQGLTNLHRLTDEHYGLDHDNYMGSLQQYNQINKNWIQFFIEQRIEPQVKLAYENGLLSQSDVTRTNFFYNNLEKLLVIDQPALVHGDLWNGNIMSTNTGQPVLIDPAVSFSHREVDLAMTKLFGGFHQTFYDSYAESFPPENGLEERLDIYQLYPLLVHLNLFGSSYRAQCTSIIFKYS